MCKRICTVDGCNSDYYGLDYCNKHWQRFKKYGDPLFTKTESHTLKNTPEYRSWSALKNRCYNKNNEYYKYYGGRGITVCDRWKNSFIAFYEDMGKKPFPKAQIDREENDGNYEPSNCRWVTALVNSQNRRSCVVNQFTVTSLRRLYKSGKYSIKELSLIFRLNRRTLRDIVNNVTWKEKIS